MRLGPIAFAALVTAWGVPTATAQDASTLLAELGGVEWHWQSTRNARGRGLLTPPAGAYRLVFVRGSVFEETRTTGATLSVATPCNIAYLEAGFQDGRLSLGATGVGSTLMWCGHGAFGPEGDALLEDLKAAVAYRVEGSALFITTERDSRVLEFVQRPLAPR